MRPWFALPSRATEATAEQVVATGAMVGTYGRDPIDGDYGYRPAGTASASRESPYWTREKARTYSVASYRSNPMAAAIIDTYVAFCVGDSGVKLQCTNDKVRVVAEEFWNDPANNLGGIQEVSLRSQMLLGEKVYELLVGSLTGVTRFAPLEPAMVDSVVLDRGNPLWPAFLLIRPPAGDLDYRSLQIARVNDQTGLREGNAMFWAPWKTLDTDTRGMPFLTSVLDWLDSYDTVLSNLIDRTALARYVAFDVTIDGNQADVDAFVAARKGQHVPPSGSVEVHTNAVTWKPLEVQTGAYEDTRASQTVLTNIAAGTGLSKPWLSEPEDANRATSQTMAEPVRRRVGGVQKVWLWQVGELVKFAVDQAVKAGRLPKTVASIDPRTGTVTEVPASQTVLVTGPEIAAADAQLNAQVLLNLATGLEKLQMIGALDQDGVQAAARKAWEDYVGVPYNASLAKPSTNPDDVATYIDDQTRAGEQ